MVRMDIMVHCIECGATNLNRFNLRPKPGIQVKKTTCKACGAKFFVELQGLLRIVPINYDTHPIPTRKVDLDEFIRGDGKFSLDPIEEEKQLAEIPTPGE